MQQINIHEAKTHLSRLLEQIESGEEIIIARNGKPIAKLIAFQPPTKKRRPGSLKDKIQIHDDFDSPLPKDIADSLGMA